MTGTRPAAIIDARCNALLQASLMPLLLLKDMAGHVGVLTDANVSDCPGVACKLHTYRLTEAITHRPDLRGSSSQEDEQISARG